MKCLFYKFKEYGTNQKGKYLYDYLTVFRPIGIDIFAEGITCEVKDDLGVCDVFKPAALPESGVVIGYIKHGYSSPVTSDVVNIYKQYEAAFVKTNKTPTVTKEESVKLLERDKKITKV